MKCEDFVSLICGVTGLVVVNYLFRLRKVPRTYLTDYMRGVRFVKGAFAQVLGPGGHQPLTRHEHIEVVDMRPAPFLLESISYRDALQSDSVISIGGELLVDDPYLAATSLKNRVSDSLPIVRQALRGAVSRKITDRTQEFRMRVAEAVTAAANEELHRVGMKVSSVEITEVFSRNASPQGFAKSLN